LCAIRGILHIDIISVLFVRHLRHFAHGYYIEDSLIRRIVVVVVVGGGGRY